MTGSNTFDLVIVGSGPAGIALAMRLRDTRLRIALVEAGNSKHHPGVEAQVLRATQKSPASHPEAHLYRRRMLGGASTVWGGRCLFYDEIDFLPNRFREGWPIEKRDVDPYVSPALSFLDAGVNRYDETAFAHPLEWGRLDAGIDFDAIERFSMPTNVWRRYHAELTASSNVEILENSVAVEIVVDSERGRATGLKLRNATTGDARQIDARRVVVAAGGIETARLLLASRSVRPRGLGNGQDLVGRYYMTHLIGDIGILRYDHVVPQEKLDYRLTSDGVYARSIMKLAEPIRSRFELPSILWRPNIEPVWNPAHGNAVLSAMHFAKSVVAKEYADRLASQGQRDQIHSTAARASAVHVLNIIKHPVSLMAFAQKWMAKRILAERKLPSVFLRAKSRAYPMEMNAEQYPDRQSRISLDEVTDRFGMPLIRLNWHAGQHTIQGIADSLTLLQKMVAESGIGAFNFDPESIEANLGPQGGHHIGTARMAGAAESGVVDRNATLFECPNIHVAGSAIFPTSGCVNPTLLAVALAMRLADHIVEVEKVN